MSKFPRFIYSRRNRQDNRDNRRVAASLLAIFIIALCLPLFLSGDKVPDFGDNDWQQCYFFSAHFKDSILEDGEFPLRSKYIHGGFPILGHPKDVSLNPLAWLFLPLSVTLEIKGYVLFLYLAGALGAFYLLSTVERLPPWTAAVGGALFVLCSPFILRWPGNYHEGYLLLCPLVAALYLKSLVRGRYVYPLSLALAFSALSGLFAYPVMLLMLFVMAGVEALGPPEAGSARSVLPFKRAAQAALLSFAAGSLKFFPLLGILLVEDRSPREYAPSPYLLGSVPAFYALLLLLAAGAVVLARQSKWRWATLLVVFGSLTLSTHGPVDLFQILARLPVYRSILQPAKYFSYPVALAVVVLVCQLLAKLAEGRRPWAKAAVVAFSLSLTILPARASVRVAEGVFRFDPPRPEREPFHSVRRTEKTIALLDRREFTACHIYLDYLRGAGAVDAYNDLTLPTAAGAKWFVEENGSRNPEPGYRGEAYFVRGGGEVEEVRIGNNRITVRVKGGRAGRLAINQRYEPYWRGPDGPAIDAGGLVAVELPAGPGRRTVTLRYLPTDFLAGLALTLLTLAMGRRFIWKNRSGGGES